MALSLSPPLTGSVEYLMIQQLTKANIFLGLFLAASDYDDSCAHIDVPMLTAKTENDFN